MRDLLKALLIGTVAADENKGKLKKIYFLFDISICSKTFLINIKHFNNL